MTDYPHCPQCGVKHEPWIEGVKTCFRCGMLNLAAHAEHCEPGDTIGEIAQGEQAGAFFRELADTEPVSKREIEDCMQMRPEGPKDEARFQRILARIEDGGRHD